MAASPSSFDWLNGAQNKNCSGHPPMRPGPTAFYRLGGISQRVYTSFFVVQNPESTIGLMSLSCARNEIPEVHVTPTMNSVSFHIMS
jgi:hypothetical protein